MSRFRSKTIYVRLGKLLALAALLASAAFLTLNAAGTCLIERLTWETNYQEREDQRRLAKLQAYLSEHQISAGDTRALAAWVKKQAVVSLQVFRNGRVLYDSYAPEEDPEETLRGIDPALDPWARSSTLSFADGGAQVVLYGFYAYQFDTCALILELVLSFALFFAVVMLGIRRTIRYIRTLSCEVKILEGGSLECPITVSGQDELSRLAQGLDAMRRSLQAQAEREKRTARASQRMVTEMSHDLRTPLTAILLYTEILSQGKYAHEAQMAEYIGRINRKARELKRRCDHLFEYALLSGEGDVVLEEPAPIRAVFYDRFSEIAAYLEQQGLRIEMDFAWEDRLIRVNQDFLTRILDNLTSNAVKYAGRDSPVWVRSLYTQDAAGFCVENTKAAAAAETESTKIGLHNICGMMVKMNGRCVVEETEERFKVSLLFPCCSSRGGTEKGRKNQDG